jgi:hypothetical protein
VTVAITAADVVVIKNYLRSVERHVAAAREALDASRVDRLQRQLDAIVYQARQAQARAEQAVLLAEEDATP